MAQNWRTIRVFISSAFLDMQAERDYLVQFTFPQLRKLCESRGVRWSDVDLCWGTSDKEGVEENVLEEGFEELFEELRGRPYFLGLLGERYGWVPTNIPQKLLERWPCLAEHRECSVTELEIICGVLEDEAMHGRGFFYFRAPHVLETPAEDTRNFTAESPEDADKLEKLKQRTRDAHQQGFCRLRENYRDVEELGRWIIEDFTHLIDKLLPEHEYYQFGHPLVGVDFGTTHLGVVADRETFVPPDASGQRGDSPPEADLLTELPEAAGEYKVEFQYEAADAESSLKLKGRVVPPDGRDVSGYTIEFTNSAGRPAWRSGKINLATDGSFIANLCAEEDGQNTFQIELLDPTGNQHETEPASLSYTVGHAITDAGLSDSIGIALANNEFRLLFEKGTPLPARRRILHRTDRTLSCGSRDGFEFPLLKGESRAGDRNPLIGTIAIRGSEITQDVPAGSEVEIAVEIDQSHSIRTKVYIPVLDAEFEKVIPLDGDSAGTATEKQVLAEIDDDVLFTVYRPRTVAPQKWYSLLAFAHLSERRPDAPEDEPDPIAEVQKQAQAILGEHLAEYKESSEESSSAVPRAGEITFRPFVEGVEFNPSSRSFHWEESVHREEFKLRASASLDGKVARGWLRVYLGPLILAQVNLAIQVNGKHVSQARKETTVSDSARPLRKVFASYSHKDLAIVEQIEEHLRHTHLGIEYLRDVTHLRAGEVWSPKLMKMIEEANAFQLFWSTNSMYSSYVRQEYQYALSLGRPYFVLPVYWEVPFPERPDEGLPPEELRVLHFENLTELRTCFNLDSSPVIRDDGDALKSTVDSALFARRSPGDAVEASQVLLNVANEMHSPVQLEDAVRVPKDVDQEEQVPEPPSSETKLNESLSPVARTSDTRRRRTSLLGVVVSLGIPLLVYAVNFYKSPFRYQRLIGTPRITPGLILESTILPAAFWALLTISCLLMSRSLRQWLLRTKVGWRRHAVWIPLLLISAIPFFPLLNERRHMWELLWLHSIPLFASFWLAYGWVRFVFLRSYKGNMAKDN